MTDLLEQAVEAARQKSADEQNDIATVMLGMMHLGEPPFGIEPEHGASATRMDAETERAARAFLRHLEGQYPVQEVLLFGSRARGTHTAESDADLAVVLRGEPGNRYQAVRVMADAAYDAMMETGVHISPLPLWESELKRPTLFSNPALIENIKREGLRL